MSKSIMHNKKDQTCYLCLLLYEDGSPKTTQEHHVIFGNGRRRLSEKYGLKVYLCLCHHTEGKESVHQNSELANWLKQQAQKEFEARYPDLDFRKIFGRNYKDVCCGAEVGCGAKDGRGVEVGCGVEDRCETRQQEQGFFFL